MRIWPNPKNGEQEEENHDGVEHKMRKYSIGTSQTS